MDAAIGPARVREAEQILKLQYLCFQDEAARYADYRLPPLVQTLHDLLAEYDSHVILAARLDDEVVGCVRGHLVEDTCHVRRLIVHPRLRCSGLGTRLMLALEAHVSQARRFELFTGHLSEGNLRLYRRLGYTLLRTEDVSPALRLVYLHKPRSA